MSRVGLLYTLRMKQKFATLAEAAHVRTKIVVFGGKASMYREGDYFIVETPEASPLPEVKENRSKYLGTGGRNTQI